MDKIFLDEIRNRTTLSALIAQSGVKIEKSGREYKACCPFHGEKTPSFTINDDKQFYHCFGCGAHGDAIRFLSDHQNMGFIDAVKQLADAAGLQVPAPSPRAAERAARIDALRPALVAADTYYRAALDGHKDVIDHLHGRGITPEMIATFGIGYAPPSRNNLSGLGITPRAGVDAGLLWSKDGAVGVRFRGRIMIPVQDARGQVIGFGGRIYDESSAGQGKYINSPGTEIFDKGRVIYNLHRAAPAARPRIAKNGPAKNGPATKDSAASKGRLIIAEGYMDVIALAGVGIAGCVAPMGTAVTIEQLQILWRVHVAPILCFDGDAAGRKAALRACITALPKIGPEGTLRVASLPDDMDPDDVVRSGGQDAIEKHLSDAQPMSDYIFDAVAAQSSAPRTPEDISAIWGQLDQYIQAIENEEVRVQYYAVWRKRYDGEISGVRSAPVVHYEAPIEQDCPPSDDIEVRFIQIVQRLLALRKEERDFLEPIREERREIRALAKVMGFNLKQMDIAIKAIEQDTADREEGEMIQSIYRQSLGIKGPLDDAYRPQMIKSQTPAIEGQSRDIIGSANNQLAWHDAQGT